MQKCIAALVALLLSVPAVATEVTVSLPGHDDLVLDVPSTWAAQVRRPKADLPPTVDVVPKAGSDLQILITPIWPMGGAKAPTLDDIRGLVEFGARQVQSQAVEQSLPLKELSGSSASGYYFSATDRQPQPDGYKYLTQGAVMLKELRITFTILVNGEPKKPTEQALEMLRNARRSPPRGAT